MNTKLTLLLVLGVIAMQGCRSSTAIPGTELRGRDGPLHVITHGVNILYLDAQNPEEPTLKVRLIRISDKEAKLSRNGVEVSATEGAYLFPEDFGQRGLKVRKIDPGTSTVVLERAFAKYSTQPK